MGRGTTNPTWGCPSLPQLYPSATTIAPKKFTIHSLQWKKKSNPHPPSHGSYISAQFSYDLHVLKTRQLLKARKILQTNQKHR